MLSSIISANHQALVNFNQLTNAESENQVGPFEDFVDKVLGDIIINADHLGVITYQDLTCVLNEDAPTANIIEQIDNYLREIWDGVHLQDDFNHGRLDDLLNVLLHDEEESDDEYYHSDFEELMGILTNVLTDEDRTADVYNKLLLEGDGFKDYCKMAYMQHQLISDVGALKVLIVNGSEFEFHYLHEQDENALCKIYCGSDEYTIFDIKIEFAEITIEEQEEFNGGYSDYEMPLLLSNIQDSLVNVKSKCQKFELLPALKANLYDKPAQTFTNNVIPNLLEASLTSAYETYKEKGVEIFNQHAPLFQIFSEILKSENGKQQILTALDIIQNTDETFITTVLELERVHQQALFETKTLHSEPLNTLGWAEQGLTETSVEFLNKRERLKAALQVLVDEAKRTILMTPYTHNAVSELFLQKTMQSTDEEAVVMLRVNRDISGTKAHEALLAKNVNNLEFTKYEITPDNYGALHFQLQGINYKYCMEDQEQASIYLVPSSGSPIELKGMVHETNKSYVLKSEFLNIKSEYGYSVRKSFDMARLFDPKSNDYNLVESMVKQDCGSQIYVNGHQIERNDLIALLPDFAALSPVLNAIVEAIEDDLKECDAEECHKIMQAVNQHYSESDQKQILLKVKPVFLRVFLKKADYEQLSEQHSMTLPMWADITKNDINQLDIQDEKVLALINSKVLSQELELIMDFSPTLIESSTKVDDIIVNSL